MDLELTHEESGLVVCPGIARIDHQVAGEFETVLLGAAQVASESKGCLVVDFSRVEFISSAGLRVLILALRRMQSAGGEVLIAGLGPRVKEIFEIAHFESMFSIFTTASDALASSGRNAASP